MMHRPPYVPKLHSSQILTRVSGRTYESHTGLGVVKRKACMYVCEWGGQGSFVRQYNRRGPFFDTKKKKSSPLSVAFLTESANG